MRINDAVSGVVAAALGAALIIAASDLSPLPRQDYGAGTFPKVVGGLLLLAGVLLVLQSIRLRQPWVYWASDIPLGRFLKGLAAVVISIVSYIALTPRLGFPVTAWGILSLLLIVYYKRGWLRSIGISALATSVIWWLFAQLLHVPLEPGLLEQVLYS